MDEMRKNEKGGEGWKGKMRPKLSFRDKPLSLVVGFLQKKAAANEIREQKWQTVAAWR